MINPGLIDLDYVSLQRFRRIDTNPVAHDVFIGPRTDFVAIETDKHVKVVIHHTPGNNSKSQQLRENHLVPSRISV